MGVGYRGKQELSMSELGLDYDEVREQGLEALTRMGAQLLLTVYVNEEVKRFLGASSYERSEAREGYRNGKRSRKVACGCGEVGIRFPKVRQTEEPFRSQALAAWQRKSEEVLRTLPLLYLEGLSTRDFRRALKPLWRNGGLSRSTISRANQQLKQELKVWRRRDLSGEKILYLFLDGFYLGVRKEERGKDGILVMHGICQDGRRVVLGIYLGGRESKASWKVALHDLIERGLEAPALVISDGNPGLIGAVKEVWPEVPRQRCIVHRMWNVLSRIPRKRQAEVKRALRKIFYAPCLEDALGEVRRFMKRYGEAFPSACEVLRTHLEHSLTFYRFPQEHWKRIRTVNVLERSFKEVRRRTKVVGRFPNETAALAVVFGILEKGHTMWQRVQVKTAQLSIIEEAERILRENPIKIPDLESAVV